MSKEMPKEENNEFDDAKREFFKFAHLMNEFCLSLKEDYNENTNNVMLNCLLNYLVNACYFSGMDIEDFNDLLGNLRDEYGYMLEKQNPSEEG